MPLPKLALAALTGGPAMLYLNGNAIYTKTGIQFDPDIKWEKILLDGFDEVDQAKASVELPIKFTPDGRFSPAIISALTPQITLPIGRWITPRLPISSIDTTSDELTVTGHGHSTGQKAYFDKRPGATFPTLGTGSITATTVYYLAAVDADTITLHPTLSDAQAGTNKINFTTAGTGKFFLIINYELIIQSLVDNTKVTFHNVGVTGNLTFDITAAGKTIWNEITVSAFLAHGKAPGDSDAYFTLGTGTFDPATFPDISDILTQPYTAAWGSTPPWDSIRSKDGWKITYTPKLEDVMVDGLGLVTKQLSGATATATFTPTDADETDLDAVQNIDTAMGSRLQSLSQNLILQGTGVYIALYKAGFTKTPELYNMKDRRAGEVTLMATRQFPGGTPQPLLYVGAAAPV